jgi:hypothetical protein
LRILELLDSSWVVQPVKPSRLIPGDIAQMQRTKLILGGLVIVPVVDWPSIVMRLSRVLRKNGRSHE